jgi:autotransporter translocation and assembly factor TamB
MSRGWRITGWILLTTIAFAVVAGALVWRSDWLRDRLRRLAESQVSKLVTGQLTIGKLSGSLWSNVVLDDVTLMQPDGLVFHAARVSATYDAVTLIQRRIVIDGIVIEQPTVRVVQGANGWNVGHLLRSSGAGGRPIDFYLAHLRLTNADVLIAPAGGTERRLRDLTADLRIVRAAGRFSIDIANATLHDDGSGYDVRQLAGRLESGLASFDLTFAGDRGPARVAGRLRGTTSAIDGDALQASVDLVGVDLQAFLTSPSWRSDVSAHADVQATIPPNGGDPAIAFQVTGSHGKAFGYEGTNLIATGNWTRGKLTFDASASGYGAAATVRASWQITAVRGASPAFDGEGVFRSVSLPRLPSSLKMPPLASRLDGTYRVHQEAGEWHANVVLGASTIEGASIAAGTIGAIAQRHGETTYSGAGSLDGLDLRRLATPLDLPVLAAARYRSRLTGQFAVEGREMCSTCPVPRIVAARATMADADLADTRMTGLSTGMALVGRQLAVVAHGAVQHLTAETMGTPESLAVDVNGTVDGSLLFHDVNAPFSMTGIDVTGVADFESSTVAGVKIDTAHVDGSLVDGVAQLRQATAQGVGLQVDGSGTLAFGDTGENKLDVTVDSSDLHAAGELAGQPIGGAAHLDAHVTGPHDRPEATGHVSLRQFTYGTDVNLLTASSDVQASMPNWQPADAVVTLNSNASFVTVKSVEINSVTGTTTYHANTLDLNLDLADASRRLQIAGELALAPADRALTVRTLSLTTGGETWALAQGATAVVRADASRVAIQGLALTNGPQRVVADGALALSGGTPAPAGLHVTFDQVQLTDANRMLLGTRQLAGLLNGDVTITGTTDDPAVEGHASITGGKIEQTTFESLQATASLAAHDLTFDATLVQSGTNQIKAAGHLPVGAGSTSSVRPMDVSITSTPIDLGLAELVTTSISKITGTATLNLKVTGSPQSPIVDGTITAANGGFTLNGSGVSYKNLTAALTFTSNRMAIDQFQIQDNDGHALDASGSLDVLGNAQDRAFDVQIRAKSVHVLNNEMGSLQLNAAVRFSGDLAAPKFDGTISLDSGRLQVDQILQKTTANTYSETPAELPGRPAETLPAGAEPAAGTPAKAPPQKSLFDRVELDLTVKLPDNLVMRGRGLHTGSGGIGLGDMNVIAGGTLRVRKPPDAALDVLGDVQVIRGTYSFQGRRFDVQRGSEVSFHGDDPTNPALDVSAERDVSGVAATVHVGGTPRRPQVTLSSEPPLDEAEILSLIVFGQPVDDLGSGQRSSLATQAGIMAAGAITTPLADSIAQALDLDVFEILAPTDTEKLPVVSVGSQIGTRVYVGAKREVGGEATALTFEYRFAKFLRLVTSFAQGALQAHTLERNEASGIDLLFVFRY